MDQTSRNREFAKRHFEAVNRREVQTVLGNMRPVRRTGLKPLTNTLCFIWLEIWSAYLMPSTRKQR